MAIPQKGGLAHIIEDRHTLAVKKNGKMVQVKANQHPLKHTVLTAVHTKSVKPTANPHVQKTPVHETSKGKIVKPTKVHKDILIGNNKQTHIRPIENGSKIVAKSIVHGDDVNENVGPLPEKPGGGLANELPGGTWNDNPANTASGNVTVSATIKKHSKLLLVVGAVVVLVIVFWKKIKKIF